MRRSPGLEGELFELPRGQRSIASTGVRPAPRGGPESPEGPGSYVFAPCPHCGHPSVLFKEYGLPAALEAYAELKKRPLFTMVNTRTGHNLPRGEVIWHILESKQEDP